MCKRKNKGKSKYNLIHDQIPHNLIDARESPQHQNGKGKQNEYSKYSHRIILAEIRGDLKSVLSIGLGEQVTNIGADVR